MSLVENKQLILLLFDKFYNVEDLSAADELMTVDVVDHSPQPGQMPGLEGVKQAFANTRAAMPDARASIEDLIAEGEKVVARFNLTGTPSSEVFGSLQAGQKVTMGGVSIFRVSNGKIEEMWHFVDTSRLTK